MKINHTPGPWELDTDGEGHIIDIHGVIIAEVYPVAYSLEGDHNAALLAAAPELLKACQLAMQSDIDGSFVSASKWWDLMKSAIEKATP